jgi:PAS domain S-box-containing protein
VEQAEHKHDAVVQHVHTMRGISSNRRQVTEVWQAMVLPARQEVLQALSEFVEYKKQQLEDAEKAADVAAASLMRLVVIIAVVSTILAVLLAVLLTRTLVSMYDTEQTANRDIAESQERMAAIVGSAMDAIISVNEEQRVVVFNRAAEKMFERKAEDAIGHDLSDFIPARFRQAHRSHVKDFGQHGVTSRTMFSPGTLYALRASGEEFPIEATISQVALNGRKIFTVILRDISERREAEQALIQSEKLATTGRMAATIAHEINNPLEAITNLVYLLNRNPSLDEEAQLLLKPLSEEVQRMGRIIKQTLGLHREAAEPVPLRLEEAVDSVLLLYARKIDSKGIQLERKIRSKGEIVGFPAEMRQVFSNMIINAIDALPAGGRLQISMRDTIDEQRGAGVEVVISDNGPGIPEGIRSRIFEPFFSTKGEKGSGVGLWVTHGIIQKHNGTLKVQSNTDREEHGTSFHIFLPCEPNIRQQPPSDAIRRSA